MNKDNSNISVRGRAVKKAVDINYINSVYYFEFDDRFEDKYESHEHWEMVYVDRGQCSIVADNNTFMLQQGEMYFHKPYEKHMLKLQKNSLTNVFIISFDSSSDALKALESRKHTASINTKQSLVTIIHEAALAYGDLTVHRQSIDYESNIWAGEQSILLRFELMLIELLREITVQTPRKKLYFSKKTIDDDFCIKIIDYMEEKLYDRLNLDELSAKMSFSKSYISKYFQRICGYSVIEYFNMMKVEEAKKLIRCTKQSFFEISESLMFSNSHYFSSTFKKYVGMTPTQYKRSCK